MASMVLIAQSHAATVRMLTVTILTASVLAAVRAVTKVSSVTRVSLSETRRYLKINKHTRQLALLISM